MKFRLALLSLLILAAFPSSLFSNTLYFPQVAYGGGYSTTFTITNTGTVPVASSLNFYAQNGTRVLALATPINLSPGSSTRVTLPNSGAAVTVVWGELIAGAGTVQGVATFDVRGSNGALLTTAGVLGLEAGSSYLLPVDVAPNVDTGVAVG